VPKRCEAATTSASTSSPATPSTGSTSTVAAPAGVLDFNDSRVRWWIRADKSNQEIGSKFAWTGVQGSAVSCDYDVIQNVSEPNLWSGQTILGRAGGWFQHRLFDGMCLWQGQRQRSAIHTSDSYDSLSSIKRGHSYWFAFGGKFHADMFTQSQPNNGDHHVQFLDFHHKAPSSALSGQSPWMMLAHSNGYTGFFLWNKADSGVSSPTGETNWDGAQRVTFINDTSKDTSKPHFFAFRFKLDWDKDASPYVEAYRQIGLDGPITRLGRWDVPNTYSGSDNLLFPKYGLHQFLPSVPGRPKSSMDMAGALIVEDLPGAVALTPETMFKSLTVAVNR
jgi:hypothetical protein